MQQQDVTGEKCCAPFAPTLYEGEHPMGDIFGGLKVEISNTLHLSQSDQKLNWVEGEGCLFQFRQFNITL